MEANTAVILAAGKGTRMRSEMAKVLHPFHGRPLVTHPLDAALAAGASRVVVVTGVQREAVQEAVLEHLGGDVSRVRFAHQAQQNGTGHAVSCALAEVPHGEGMVWILNGDTPLIRAQTLARLRTLANEASSGLAMTTIAPEDCTGYGRVIRDASGNPAYIREERDCSPDEFAVRECNAGMYCVRARHLHTELPTLGSSNAQGEIYLTDLVELRAQHGVVAAEALSAVEAAGINTPEQLAALEAVVTPG